MQQPEFPGLTGALHLWGEKIVSAMQQTLRGQDHYATHELEQSIRFEISYMAMPITFQLTLLDYYKYVDEGRKPGGKQPPPEMIRQWIVDKHFAIRGRESARIGKLVIGKRRNDRRDKPVADNEKLIKSLAFLIGRKIGRFGIPASNFFSDAVNDASIQQLQAELSKAFKQDVLVQIIKIKDQINNA